MNKNKVNLEISNTVLIVPEVKKHLILEGSVNRFLDWNLLYTNILDALIFDKNRKLEKSLISALNNIETNLINKNGERFLIEIKGVQVLICLFSNEKEICIYTQRACYELTMLRAQEPFNLNYLNKILETNEFNCYVKKLSELKLFLEKTLTLNYKTFSLPVLKEVKGYSSFILNNENLDPIIEKANELAKGISTDLLKNVNSYKPTVFEIISDFFLDLSATYSLIRIHLLKFLAILPSLDHDKSGKEVKRILLESIRRLNADQNSIKFNDDGSIGNSLKRLPTIYIIILNILSRIFGHTPSFILASLIRFSVRFMAQRFIAGENIIKASGLLKKLNDSGREATIDQLGELVVSEKEADNYTQEVIKIIKGLKNHLIQGEKNKAGILKSHVSIKVSALCNDFKYEDFDYSYSKVYPRLLQIFQTAKNEKVFINVDAEHYQYRDLVFNIFKKILIETEELKNYEDVGIVVQAYLRDSLEHTKDIIELAQSRKITMPIRLVKGAYWDAEVIESEVFSYDAPQFLNKEETDINFRQICLEILKSSPHLQLCIGSHNLMDHCFSEALKDTLGSNCLPIEHQCLHMTYEPLSTGMTSYGWPVRNYVPLGDLLVGMSYLVRRIIENSSQVGVLAQIRSHKRQGMYKKPEQVLQERYLKRDNQIVHDRSIRILSSKFFNVAPLRFYKKNNLDSFNHLVQDQYKKIENSKYKSVKNELRLTGPVNQVVSASMINKKSDIVGEITFANSEDVSRIVNEMFDGYSHSQWRMSLTVGRVSALIKAANLMLIKRQELACLIIFESSKTYKESLADVDEAIDFINFYSREQLNYVSKKGEKDYSRGLISVISPWNFPIAIACGMVSSALVCGNSVILKSAEQTPLIANELINIFLEAGVPSAALCHLPGNGETVGDALVNNSKIAGYMFTGSKSVGHLIYKKAKTRVYENPISGFRSMPLTISEMGGKNSIIILENAELDEAITGVIYSSFAHSGQKCSACSRIIINSNTIDIFSERFKHAVSDLVIGEAYEPSTYINPLITKSEKDFYIQKCKAVKDEIAKSRGKILVDRSDEVKESNIPGPLVVLYETIKDVPSDSYFYKELFSPIIYIVGFSSLDESIDINNNNQYALTCGIFSQSQDDIDYLIEKIEAGNIYINRSCTGARVAIEPFGGFKNSGTGPKAGGVDYLHTIRCHSFLAEEGLILDKFVKKNELTLNTGFKDKISEIVINELPKKSELAEMNRLIKFNNAINYFLEIYENIHLGTQEEKKSEIKKLRKYLNLNMHNYTHDKHINKNIPGQKSYSINNMKKNFGLIISKDPFENNEILNYFFSAVSLGVGVTIFCLNDKSLKFWEKTLECFYQGGFSDRNLKAYPVDNMERFVSVKEWEFILHDSNIDDFVMALKIYFNKSKLEKYLPKVLEDHTNLMSDYEKYLRFFCNQRSFAENLMRHGAPLDVNYS
jgi:RHH-type transcriptional regulator, proline utilization regulon repressor / proline dehydrogenase / delta 1-pyrroline-5-carboxylate dehydrogenase